MDKQIQTLKICVMSFEEMKAYSRAYARDVTNDVPRTGAIRAFVSQELLWKKLTPKRLEILNAMVGAGPMSIRGLARRLSRDVKAVHGDVQILLKDNFITKTQSGEIELPFDEVRLEVAMKAQVAA